MKSVLATALLTICFAANGMAAQPPAASSDALIDAIRDGDRATVESLLRGGADANAAQGDGTTALHWAVYRVDAGMTQALLARGAKAEARNRFGATPLLEATKVGNVELVRLLLKAGAKTETANDDGQTPLMVAARVGSLETARELVKHGAKVNPREGWREQTALMWAAAGAHPEVVQFLVSKGADVSARAAVNDWGNQVTSEPRAQYRPTGGLTPLLYAARSGCEPCVDALLKGKADIDLPTPDGVTPLMMAIDNLNYGLAGRLLARGADPNLTDWWGRTALYIAADVHLLTPRAGSVGEGDGKGSAIDVMRQLLKAGVDPNPQLNMHRPGRNGNSGRFTDDLLTVGATPLLRAAISYDNEAIGLLLANGALVDLPNGMGATPLMAAAGLGVSIRDPRGNYTGDIEERSIATMKILIAAGADVNARVSDTSGRTARIARPSTMTTRQGQTAIYGPINWGWIEVTKFLLAQGARVDIKDASGKSPIDASKGNAGGRDFKAVPEIVKLIETAAAATTAQR